MSKKTGLAGIIKGKTLHYGCGKGRIASLYGWDRYDPEYFPTIPKPVYETVMCTTKITNKPKLALLVNELLSFLDKSKNDTAIMLTTKKQVSIKAPVIYSDSSFHTYLIDSDIYELFLTDAERRYTSKDIQHN